jgi:hypothetical protein
MNLQLSLKKKWFNLTKSGEKTEDYREIKLYWIKRLINLGEFSDNDLIGEFLSDIEKPLIRHKNLDELISYYNISFKKFNNNTITLGYPKKIDSDKILILEHKGIEIREGNPEWGAEPGKLYFVIMHGVIITK